MFLVGLLILHHYWTAERALDQHCGVGSWTDFTGLGQGPLTNHFGHKQRDSTLFDWHTSQLVTNAHNLEQFADWTGVAGLIPQFFDSELHNFSTVTSHVLQNCGVGFRALFTGPGDVGGRLQQNISCSDPYLRGSCISTVHCAEIFTGVGSQDFLTGLVVDFLQVTPTPFHITLTIICWVTKSWTERFIRSDTYQQYIGALTVNGGRVEIGVGSHDFLTGLDFIQRHCIVPLCINFINRNRIFALCTQFLHCDGGISFWLTDLRVGLTATITVNFGFESIWQNCWTFLRSWIKRFIDFDQQSISWQPLSPHCGVGSLLLNSGLGEWCHCLHIFWLRRQYIGLKFWTEPQFFLLSGGRILLLRSQWLHCALTWTWSGTVTLWTETVGDVTFNFNIFKLHDPDIRESPLPWAIFLSVCTFLLIYLRLWKTLVASLRLLPRLVAHISVWIKVSFCPRPFQRQKPSLSVQPSRSLKTRGGQPGPKSRGRLKCIPFCRLRIFHLIVGVFLLHWILQLMESTGGEGCAPVMGSAGASTMWQQGLIDKMDAKQHDMQPDTSQKLTWSSAHTKVKKRSIRRAFARACQHGLAWYRGRCYTPSDFPNGMHIAPPKIQDPQKSGAARDHIECNRRHQDSQRLRLFHWNTGGLNFSKLDEIKIWLDAQRIDAAFLTETRMTFEAEWSDANWHHVHTGQGNDRGAGVICLISTRLCTQQQIRWRSVLPGRLMHLQIQGRHRSIDFVGCYQHTQGHTAKRRNERLHWWKQLDTLLRNLATRNTLFLAGDFNTCLPQCSSHAGPSHFRWRGTMTQGAQHEDQGQFMSTLRMHGLVALNTWHPEAGPTFQSPTACSRIDYIITRKTIADGCAKNIRYTWDAPFCTSFGHAPMIGLLRKHWLPPAHESQVPNISPGQRQQGLLAFHAESEQWQCFLNALCEPLQNRLMEATPSDSTVISDLHHIACQHFNEHFPRHGKPKQTDTQAKTTIMTKWFHRRELRNISNITFSNLFHAWYHSARFQRLKRQARKHAIHVRQLRFEEVTTRAAIAASRHDTHSLFRIINQFTPKQPKRRMQLRNLAGQIATPTEETAMLTQFIQDTWHGPSTFPVSTAPLTGLPFTVEELAQALKAIPAVKAVARPCAPGTVWKGLALQLAPILHSVLESWWISPKPYIPHWFKAGWMLLIPKPNKPPVHPRALRPLALQEPLGKTVMGLLAAKAQNAIMPTITIWPIWSYLPKRSTQDAILRVVLHCKEVRTLLAAQRPTPFCRAKQTPRLRIAGGIGVFLDIERAFDMVSRPQLFTKLTAVGVPAPIAHILTLWHQETGYYLFSHGEETHIPVGRGLRQGCKAAPLLWNIYVLLFLAELSKHVDRQWILTCLNFYADDGQLGNAFRSEAALDTLLSNLSTTLALLQEFGMTINSAKCTALVAVRGTASRKLRSKLIAVRDGKEWLKIPGAGSQTFWIPIATHVKYLGVVLSYHTMEDKTIQHRIQLSKIAFGRLARWLQNKRGLPQWQRLRLWSTCVYPVLSYGICTVGITQTGLLKFQQHMYSMLRQVLGDHAFLTRHSHRQALSRHGVDLPFAWLWRTADSLLQSATQRLHIVTSHDIVHQLDWSHLHQLKDFLADQLHRGLEEQTASPPSTALPSEPVYFCQVCGFYTDQVADFRRHCTIVHGLRMNRSKHVNPAMFMLNGLPQCRYCFQTFTTWRSFHVHIQRGCQAICAGPEPCWQNTAQIVNNNTVFPAQMADSKLDGPVRGQRMITDADLRNLTSQEWGSRVLEIVGHRHWHHMRREQTACEYLATRCCLCDQFLGRTQDLNHHLKTMHPEYWPHTAAKGKQLTNMYGEDTPCPYCHAVFKNMHQCTVWTQLAMLVIYGGGQTHAASTESSSGLACEICGQQFDNAEALHSHLARAHRLVSSSFNLARDSVAGQPACNHCGGLFDGIESLRSHVNQGRCPTFNPDLPTEVVDVQQRWTDATCHGQLAKHLGDAHTRLQLTLRCQSCSAKYSRSADMMGHLQTAHSALWSASQPLTHLLIELAYSEYGCTCNPSVHAPRAHHVCVTLRQLAMQHMRIPDAIFFPRMPTEEELTGLFSSRLDRAMRFQLERLITTQNFAALWSDDHILAMTRSTCVLCAEPFHVGELALHLQEAHRCRNFLVKFLMSQMIERFLHHFEHDHQCFACHQVINHPTTDAAELPDLHRQQVVQVHLRSQCPCLLQAAVILSRAAYGRTAHGRRRGCNDPDLAGIPGTLTHPGPDPEAESECTAQATKKRRTHHQAAGTTGKPRKGSTGAGSGPPHQAHPQTGQGAADTEEGGHLRLLFRQQRERELLANPGPGNGGLGGQVEGEAGGGDHGENAATPPTSLAGAPEHPTDQSGTAGECTRGLRDSEGGDAYQGAPAGQDLSLLGMVPLQEGADCQQEEAPGTEATASDLHRSPGGLDQSSNGGEVSFTPFWSQAGNLPLETPSESAAGSPLATASGAMRLSNLAADGSIPQGAQLGTKPSGPQLAEGHEPALKPPQGQGKGEGQDGSGTETGVAPALPLTPHMMLQRLAHLTWDNPGNFCFANAAAQAMLWTTLSTSTWQTPYWGEQCQELQNFLASDHASGINLSCTDWFQQIVRCWGDRDPTFDPDQITQQDAAEFVATWFSLMRPMAFDMAWERRFEENGNVRVFDVNSTHQPICLKFDAMLAYSTTCDLTQLFNLWCQVDGMRTALLGAPPCLCIQIDRCVSDAMNNIFRSECMIQTDEPCLVPFFQTNTLQYETAEYHVVALTAHLGMDRAGHIRTALRLAPSIVCTVHPANWLLTEDWKKPEPIWDVPCWMKRHATMYWLTRADCLHLWRFRPFAPANSRADHVSLADPEAG